MSYVIPAYLPAYVLIGSVAAITAVLVAVHRGLKGAACQIVSAEKRPGA